MWPRDLIRLPSLLVEVTQLLREQNSLLRELIQFHTRRPAHTAPSAGSSPLQPPKPIRQFTMNDVHVVTRERRLELDQQQRSRQIPWRTPQETLASLHAEEPTFDQPIPDQPMGK